MLVELNRHFANVTDPVDPVTGNPTPPDQSRCTDFSGKKCISEAAEFIFLKDFVPLTARTFTRRDTDFVVGSIRNVCELYSSEFNYEPRKACKAMNPPGSYQLDLCNKEGDGSEHRSFKKWLQFSTAKALSASGTHPGEPPALNLILAGMPKEAAAYLKDRMNTSVPSLPFLHTGPLSSFLCNLIHASHCILTGFPVSRSPVSWFTIHHVSPRVTRPVLLPIKVDGWVRILQALEDLLGPRHLRPRHELLRI